MSGGVDSSVAAALLNAWGFEVIGLTLQLLPKDLEGDEPGLCCGIKGITDARRVAGRIGIPHYVLNLRDVFAETVIAPFIDEYQKGRTPNPCVNCNRYLKFGALYHKIRAMDCDFLATGHYAQTRFNLRTGAFELHTGSDLEKNQSYFLYHITQECLSRTLFPVGALSKAAVREWAGRFDLPVAQKPGSMDICFVANGDYPDFLARYGGLRDTPGDIVHLDGTVMGRHKGISRYTIGQRRGLGIGHSRPLYVYDIRPESNTVVVGEAGAKSAAVVSAKGFHCINPEERLTGRVFDLKLRYKSGSERGSVIAQTKDHVTVQLNRPVTFITPGQSLVLFDGTRVVGGGIIQAGE